MLVSVEIVSRCKLVKAWGVHQVSEIATIYYRLSAASLLVLLRLVLLSRCHLNYRISRLFARYEKAKMGPFKTALAA